MDALELELEPEASAWLASRQAGADSDGGVGLFLLRSPQRSIAEVVTVHALRTINAAGGDSADGASQPPLVLLHVMAHTQVDYNRDLWRAVLGGGGAVRLLGGVHFCGEENRFFEAHGLGAAPGSGVHDGNYAHKTFASIVLARRRGYAHVMSLDDDVLLPPSTLSLLLSRSVLARALSEDENGGSEQKNGGPVDGGKGLGCAWLTPSLNNGIPTVELFGEDALPRGAREELQRCFEATTLPDAWGYGGSHVYDGKALSHSSSMATTAAQPNGGVGGGDGNGGNSGGRDGTVGWGDGRAFYARVGELVAHHARDVHPVRTNDTCMDLALRLALDHAVPRLWGPGTAAPLGQQSADANAGTVRIDALGVAEFPYFANSVWVSTTAFYGAVLGRRDLWVDFYDEVPANRLRRERDMPLCVLRGKSGSGNNGDGDGSGLASGGGQAVHPGYNSHPGILDLERRALAAVVAAIGDTAVMRDIESQVRRWRGSRRT
jgi:hypothetical protein